MDHEPGGASGDWLQVCALDELAAAGVKTLALPELNVAVFRLADERMFGIEDRCPHRGCAALRGRDLRWR